MSDEIQPAVSLKYVEVPFFRIRPFKPGRSPVDSAEWPNEPCGYIKIPVVFTPTMSEEAILLEAITMRDILLEKWLTLGNCTR